ncbi:unnamed protein product [Closterium sp. NIES-53]
MYELIPLFLEGSVWQSVRAPGLAVTFLRQVAASSQVFASGQLAASCSCRYALPSPCLWPSQVPALPPVLTSPGVPSLRRGRQCVAPHSSEFPPTTAPLQTLHMDVWGRAPVGGMDQECYFQLVVDDNTRYTTVFPL